MYFLAGKVSLQDNVKVPNRVFACREPDIIVCLCIEQMENVMQMQKHLYIHIIQCQTMTHEPDAGRTGSMLCRG